MASNDSFRSLSVISLLALPVSVLALTPLDDQGLAQVNGRDGLTVNLQSQDGIQLEQVRWETDISTPQEAHTQLDSLALEGVGGPLAAQLDIDVGNDGVDPMLAIKYQWGPARFTMGGMRVATPTNPTPALPDTLPSLGQAAFYSQGQLDLVNRGLFDNAANKARLDFNLTGDWVYRQGEAGSAEMSLGNLVFSNRFTNGAAGGHADGVGTVAIDSDGIKVASDFTESILQFDLMYNDSASDFDINDREAMMHAGWIGGLANTLFRIDPGGVGDNTLASRTQGINVQAQWDFDTDFILNLGHAGGNTTQLQLRDWRMLGNAPGRMLNMDITLDVLQDGAGTGGLCFGVTGLTCGAGDFYNTTADAGQSAFAILLRDSYLHAYAENIAVDELANVDSATPYNWSVLLTLGLLEADILVYPGGPFVPGGDGLRLDAAVMVQSPGFWADANSSNQATRQAAGANWQTNTHFLLADTAAEVGIGLMNADILWEVDDLYFLLGDSGNLGVADPTFPNLRSGLMLGTNVLSRYQVRGMFGAGSPSDLGSNTANVALWDFNLSTDQFRFVLYPTIADGSEALGFDGYLHLDGSSYLSLAEVSSPESAFRISDVTGSIGWKDGSVTVRSENETTDGLPSITLRNELLLGQSADFGQAGGGSPLVGNVGFGDQDYGRIALPGGVWESEIIAKIPQ